MDFSFSDEQSMLKDSVERFIQNDYGFEDRQKVASLDAGFSAENWKTFAELGWLGVPFTEADGGFGGGAVETMLRIIESTVPVQRIWLDTVEKGDVQGASQDGVPVPEIREMARVLLAHMIGTTGLTPDVARSQLLATEPFQNYPDIVDDIVGERIEKGMTGA